MNRRILEILNSDEIKFKEGAVSMQQLIASMFIKKDQIDAARVVLKTELPTYKER